MQPTRPLLALFLLPALAACGGSDAVPLPAVDESTPAPWNPDVPYVPNITPDQLSTAVTNPYFPAPVGATWVYEGPTDEGMERIEIEVLEETRDVWGVTARVIRDTVYLEGELIEDTWDWFAQDADENVWYLGEETYEYEDGEIVCDCGAWEAGVDGALPGIVVLGAPAVGKAYRQEFYAGEAEDLAEVVAVGVTVTVRAGTFDGCIRTRDLTLLERDAEEFKTLCPGVGVVLEEVPEDDERIELVEYAGLGG